MHTSLGYDPVLSPCFLEDCISDWRTYLQEGQNTHQYSIKESVISSHLMSGDILF